MSSKGNEYFCEVDEDFILDRFNLTGLNNEVANYPQALDLITDSLGEFLNHQSPKMCLNSHLDDDIQDELRGSLDVQARLLYGLIHARWIVTARGLTKMVFCYLLMPFKSSETLSSSINSSAQTSDDAHAFFAHHNHSCLSALPTFPTRNLSNSFVEDARTSTRRSHLDMALSMARTLARHSLTYYSWSIRP